MSHGVSHKQIVPLKFASGQIYIEQGEDGPPDLCIDTGGGLVITIPIDRETAEVLVGGTDETDTSTSGQSEQEGHAENVLPEQKDRNPTWTLNFVDLIGPDGQPTGIRVPYLSPCVDNDDELKAR